MGRYIIPVQTRAHRMGGLGSYGGLGSDATKENLKLSKAIANNQLTASEVNLVRTVWAKWDADFKSLTAGKHGKSSADAIKILGERKTIEQIVGHALVTPAVTLPGGATSPVDTSSPPESSGPSIGLIAVLGIAAVGAFVFMRKG